MQAGAILQTCSQSVGMFIASRGLLGFGLSFAGLASPLLIGEIAYPAHRGTCTAFFGVNYSLGSIIAAWVTFGTFRIPNTWSWRIPSLMQGLPALIQMIGIWFVPESPRWLINKGRDEEALRILAKWHCNGDVDDPLVAYEYQEIREALNIEKEAKDSTSYRSIISTKGNRKRLLVVICIGFFSQWSGNGLVSYYLNLVLNGVGITDPFSQTLFNGILTIVNWGWAILGAFLVDRAGRRTLFLVSTGGMCFSYVIWTICSAIYAQSATNLDSNGNPVGANNNAGRGVLAFIFVYYAFYNIAFAPLLALYTIEITPFRVRAKYITIGSLSINCALVFVSLATATMS
jgi:sugar porter (SP) family MFS transporter